MASGRPSDFKLLNHGRAPLSGEDDERYILRRTQQVPDVRIWPGLRIRRKWRTSSQELTIESGVVEGENGPIFFFSARRS